MRSHQDCELALECLRLAQRQAGHADHITGQGVLPGSVIVGVAEQFFAFVTGASEEQSRAKLQAVREFLTPCEG